MLKTKISQVVLAGSIVLSGLMITSAPATAQNRGFVCDTSSIDTLLIKGDGSRQTWIRWRNPVFARSGYDPMTRCLEVSSRLERMRQNQQLDYITLGRMNGQNVICRGTQPGFCAEGGLIYTLAPDEPDPIGALYAFLAWRTQDASARTRYESKDDTAPLIDVRFAVADTARPDQAPGPNLSPLPSTPGSGGSGSPDL